MNRIAADFLTRCFAPDETIAILLRRENPASTMQRIVALEKALASRYLGWLAHENSIGSNIYVAANPIIPGSRKRTKDSIACVRHLYLDIDTDGEVRLGALQASDAVPAASAVLSTSPGKYQVLWQVVGFNFEQQEEMLKVLSVVFGGDPACTDRNRVLRVPGFFNRKYDPAHLVAVEYPCDSVWTRGDFDLDTQLIEAGLFGRAPVPQYPRGKHSNSEEDWTWVLSELASGSDALELTLELSLRRTDKPNPSYYAQRTVDMASARLWLSEGTSIADVIAMLEARRLPEIPAALCSARAREIAVTAQRMVSRSKTS